MKKPSHQTKNPKNAYLAKLEQSMRDRARIAQYVEARQSLDAMILAANETFGFGEARIRRLIDAWIAKREELAEFVMEDRIGNNDPHFLYARTKVDKALRRVMGEDYPSHEKRYVINLGKPLFEGGIVIGRREEAYESKSDPVPQEASPSGEGARDDRGGL